MSSARGRRGGNARADTGSPVHNGALIYLLDCIQWWHCAPANAFLYVAVGLQKGLDSGFVKHDYCMGGVGM